MRERKERRKGIKRKRIHREKGREMEKGENVQTGVGDAVSVGLVF